MAPITTVLDAGASVVVGASGTASVRIGPTRVNQRWRVTGVSVDTTTAVLVPTAKLYRGNPGAVNSLGGSYTGTGGNSTDLTDVTLYRGEYLTVVWAGADVGCTATVSINGTIVVAGD